VNKKESEKCYVLRKAKLLKAFDKTASIVREVFVSRWGDELGSAILKQTRAEYEALIGHIPYIGGHAPPALRLFIIVSAWELAVYKAMKRHGKSAEEAWELCHEALKVRLKTAPGFVRYLIRFLLFSSLIRKRARKIAERSQRHPFGHWAFRFVEGDGKKFDWGVDYIGCSIYKFIQEQDAEEFAPYVCLSDIALSDTFGWGLIRTQTIADGCEFCDFRFKKGGETKISSKTPEVQAMIEKTLKSQGERNERNG
jgi:hypothetical protein